MKIRELSLLFYSLFMVAAILLYLIYTKQGTEGFEPISNFDEDRIQSNPVPRIKCESGDKKITISWTQNNSRVKNYLLVVRPVRKPRDSILYKVHNKPNCSNCVNVIDGLTNGEIYEIRVVVFLKNKKKMYGEPITCIPNGPMDNDQMSDLLVNNIDVSEEVADASCDYYRDMGSSLHALDKPYETINEYISK